MAAAEDDREAGARELGLLDIRPGDAVVGVSASGSTPYVVGALETATTAGALTACVVCAPGSTLGSLVDHEIVVVVGPEFIAGSTRLKAGTAQKLVLNAISTITMIRLGKTYGNLMVDVVAANEKLVGRVRRIVAAATGATARGDRRSAGGGGRRRAGRDRLARRRCRRRRSARTPRGLRPQHRRRRGGRAVRLGVEAALVDGQLVPGDLEILGGRVAAFGLSSPNGRGIAVPGFVDLQVNGFGGVDFLSADAEGYRQAGEALLETGVTAYLPTFITSPEEQLLAALREVPAESDGPRVLGAHLEGPFISALRLGIHPAEARRNPDPELLDRLLAAGPVRLVTLAPELPGAHR